MAARIPPQNARNARELEERILLMLRELYYPPQTDKRAASELRLNALQFNLTPCIQDYPPGQAQKNQKQLVSLQGNLPFQYNGRTQGIPICVFALPCFPDQPPVIIVVPPSGLVVPPGHPLVRHDGLIVLRELDRGVWQAKRISLYTILNYLQLEFARLPPLTYDPVVAERHALQTHLHSEVRQRLQEETLATRQELSRIETDLQNLRNVEALDDPNAEDIPAERALELFRQHRLKLDRQIEVYGMRDGDIAVDDFVACDMDDLQLEKANLRADDKAHTDALNALSQSLSVTRPEIEPTALDFNSFLNQSMRLATAQYNIRDKLHRIDRTQARSVEAVPISNEGAAISQSTRGVSERSSREQSVAVPSRAR